MEIEQLRRCQPPRLFRPHPNLSDEVNRHLVQSQIEGGVRVEDLVPGSRLQVKTQNTCYRILILFGAMALITGHPLFCPRPVLITIHGSTWGGSMLKVRFIGRGMHLEFHHPDYSTPIVTSPIQEIQELPQRRASEIAVLA
jgi:hypothetical protein